MPDWRGRAGTLRAMTALCAARLLIGFVPFRLWRRSLGGGSGEIKLDAVAEGRRLARQVEWAVERLPISIKCLPQAMALSWLLRRRRIAHEIVFAARPANLRNGPDGLHAWVEIGGATVIGDLPGPWLETLRLGRA